MFQAQRQINNIYAYPYSKVPSQSSIYMNNPIIQSSKNQIFYNNNDYKSSLSPNQIKDNFSMKNLNSPEIKINYDSISSSPFIPKGIKVFQRNNNQCSFESLRTSASNSNESLLSNSNSQIPFNLRQSYENIQKSNNLIINNDNNYNNLPICNLRRSNSNFNEIFGHKNYFLNNIPVNNLFTPNINNINEENNLNDEQSFNNYNCENGLSEIERDSFKKNSKIHFNKFNSMKENSSIDNTVILTIRIKVSKNDYRIFNLKKYDDLFISIQKFFDLNQIKSELIRPTVIKIFSTLNKIFWLCNSKIGIYDQQYLKTLYKIWLKNGKNIPKYKEEEGDSSLSEDSNKESKSYQAENSLENNDNNRQDTAKSY